MSNQILLFTDFYTVADNSSISLLSKMIYLTY